MTAEAGFEKQAYEERLQRRMKILKKQFDADKIRIKEGLNVIDSLKKVRYAADGSVDLSTVDGLVRSMALAVESMHDREEMKKEASLAEVQTMYFEFLEKNFGHFYKIMVDRALSPHDAGVALSGNEETIIELVSNLPDFLETIDKFWEGVGEIAHAHAEDMQGVLKGVFGGDLFPSSASNIASKCGIYTDTIILPDPFLRSRHIFARATDKKKAYFLIKHGLNLLQYKTLACANVNPPIVAVLPDRSELDEDEKKWFHRLGKDDAVTHAGKIFGREFQSFEEVVDFSSTLDTVDSVVASVSDKTRILFDTEWEGTIAEQIFRATQDSMFSSMLGPATPGLVVALQALGRMGTSNELLIKAQRLRGTPIIDAPTSWQYFVWKLEYDAAHSEESQELPDLHIVRGLHALAETEMQWLGRVPPAALIEIRTSGAMDEIRGMLTKGIEDLVTANPTNFHRTTDLVFENIQLAFAEHRKNVAELNSKKWKFAGSEVGSWLVVGSLAVAAAATGAPVWGLAALAADQLLPSPKLKDIPESIRSLAKETTELKRSPVGMLFKLSKSGA
jgi:hypothetical protein